MLQVQSYMHSAAVALWNHKICETENIYTYVCMYGYNFCMSLYVFHIILLHVYYTPVASYSTYIHTYMYI